MTKPKKDKRPKWYVLDIEWLKDKGNPDTLIITAFPESLQIAVMGPPASFGGKDSNDMRFEGTILGTLYPRGVYDPRKRK